MLGVQFYNQSDGELLTIPTQLQYGTGNVTGDLIVDVFSMGDPAITFNQSFGDALDLTNIGFTDISSDGLWGLSPPSDALDYVTSPFVTMVQEGILDAPKFSLWLSPDLMALEAGELVFGGVNSAHIAVSSNDFYLINQAVPDLTFDYDYDTYVIPCAQAIQSNGALPEIGFTMNGTTYSLPPTAWILTVSLTECT
ncbi:hypothetical protein WJX73_005783 [Symbiochloris irregularis]|uniref:Peptidase A1 domain-containing protein n=1 Tax=Symbiochloris irregularis TaxID=706552 RepID=A0AAW1Q1U5_9CHLO